MSLAKQYKKFTSKIISGLEKEFEGHLDVEFPVIDFNLWNECTVTLTDYSRIEYYASYDNHFIVIENGDELFFCLDITKYRMYLKGTSFTGDIAQYITYNLPANVYTKYFDIPKGELRNNRDILLNSVIYKSIKYFNEKELLDYKNTWVSTTLYQRAVGEHAIPVMIYNAKTDTIEYNTNPDHSKRSQFHKSSNGLQEAGRLLSLVEIPYLMLYVYNAGKSNMCFNIKKQV